MTCMESKKIRNKKIQDKLNIIHSALTSIYNNEISTQFDENSV